MLAAPAPPASPALHAFAARFAPPLGALPLGPAATPRPRVGRTGTDGGEHAGDGVEGLMRRVSALAVAFERPEAPVTAARALAYAGDVVGVGLEGDRRAREALVARLLLVAAVGIDQGRGRVDVLAVLRRLERALRRWDADRGRGAAGRRPRAGHLRACVAMLDDAEGLDPAIGVDAVAFAAAELVAIQALGGGLADDA